MLSEQKLKELKKELDECTNPVFVHDKDADGLCSFLLFYKYKKEGTGFPLMTKNFDEGILNKVKESDPDKVFFLDIPMIPQHFIDELKIPAIQVDHHLGGLKVRGMKIFNPRDDDKKDSSPTSTICYNVVKENLWICAAGTVADWHLTEETRQYAKERPDMLDIKFTKPDDAMFESKIGQIGRIFNFIQKGKTSDIHKVIKQLLKVNIPEEILEQTTKEGEAVYKKYHSIYQRYKEILEQALKQMKRGKLFVFIYPGVKHGDDEVSFTSELSNEILHNHPKKVLVIAREKNDEMKCSIRSGTIEIRTKMLEALKEVGGTGGGHDYACGASVATKDFETFIEKFKKLI